MYADPKRVREPYTRLRLNQYEAQVLDALVAFTGLSRAELIRQIVMNEAVEMFGVDVHGSSMPAAPADCAGRNRAG